MAAWESTIRTQAGPRVAGSVWIEPLLGLGLGAAGGPVRSALLTTSLAKGLLLGGIFVFAFGLFFAQRATRPGEGFLWGVVTVLCLWASIPARILSLFPCVYLFYPHS